MRRVLTTLAVTVMMMALAPPVGAHPDDPSETPEEIATSDNLEFVEHHYFPEGSDMYFQRREGRQLLDGEVIDETRDYAFVGGDGNSSDVDGAMHIFDVTDPTEPVHLVDAQCQGYHAEVVVYENLMIQGIDSSGEGCTEEAAERFDPHGLDDPGVGIRIWDVTDPANPTIQHFIGPDELGGGGVHNLTVHAEAGLLYLASSDFTTESPRWGYVELTDPAFPVTVMDVKEITPNASAACHDIGMDYDRDFAFCAAVEQTFIWDVSDPRMPQHVSTIVNPDITIHHGARLAPDGTTLVLNDELAGAAFSPGCVGTGSLGGVGALWFYDTTDPSSPTPMGSFTTEEVSASTLCTSHFYNFIPDSTLLVVGWYESGVIVVDYEDPSGAFEHAFLRPGGAASFWSAYYWHGYVYGASRTLRADGNGGGFWIAQLDGVDDREPWSADEGTSWGRWTSQIPLACPPDAVPPSGLGDIAGSVHEDNIECIAWYTITEGRGDTDGDGANDYDGELGVLRSQMASYLARLLVEGGVSLPADPPDAFEDDDGSVHEHAINQLAALGIVKGTGDSDDNGRPEYSPAVVVTRAQMASFIARVHEEITGSLPADAPDAFDDDDGSEHELAINQLAALGVVQGRQDDADVDGDGDTSEMVYLPRADVLRSTMATFLANDLRLAVQAGHAYVGGAQVDLNSTRTTAGDELQGSVTTNKQLVGLVADGCGFDTQDVAVSGDGTFTLTVAEDQSGECTLTLTHATRRPDADADETQVGDATFAVTVAEADGEDAQEEGQRAR